ncbi:Hint domain-containing protein [Phaeovulum sp. NW3]|uniref:Hint domain-containing protein n=1 Tax=Phaeovulum sp. NW3 TaxID=2934933 RepID=UPI00201FC892|nr:Hint domain-containing protein [Phaeovulum sp. NW3]MCL7465457.1 Hint domain-containing protein [Phaeovulum sp. NW3]
MAIFQDQFYLLDPANPPPAGTTLSVLFLTIDDNNNNLLNTTPSDNASNRDLIDGVRVIGVYVNDTITVEVDGETQTITGVTFHLADGRRLFTPIDGSKLNPAVFVSSTSVPNSTQISPDALGIPCFTAGTLIDTPEGRKPVEWLRPGDLVSTRDHGAQPLRWVGKRKVDAWRDHAPIRFEPGAIDNPEAIEVSPQHRMLLCGWRAEIHLGAPEVLIAAKHLINGHSVRRAPRANVTYVHLLLDRHEILTANGAASESFFPGDTILESDPALRAELVAIGALMADGRAAPHWRLARPLAHGSLAQLLSA